MNSAVHRRGGAAVQCTWILFELVGRNVTGPAPVKYFQHLCEGCGEYDEGRMRNIARKFLDYARKVSLSCKHVYVVFEIVNAIMLSPRASMAALCAPLIVLFA